MFVKITKYINIPKNTNHTARVKHTRLHCRHTSFRAPNTTTPTVKDAKGKVQMRMSPKPSGVEIRQYAYRSVDQTVESAAGVLKRLRNLAAQKRERNKYRRQKKNEKEGTPPVRQGSNNR
eukprot:GHVS01001724.1.p1 GENE.GHVS01001724.1~~GHVS01001724.1.p1  ORF type:complete len:120 (-),score=8.05 GHVS01001724.1:498-857(-)